MALKIERVLKDFLLQDTKENILLLSRGLALYTYDLITNQLVRLTKVSHTGLERFPGIYKISKTLGILELFEARFLSDKNHFIVIINGGVYLLENGRFKLLFTLDNHGFLKGRGVLPNGLLIDSEIIYIGEYWRNKHRQTIHIYRYNMKSHELLKIKIPWNTRHIHFIQKDPFTNKIFVGTGDTDNESVIATIEPATFKFDVIGKGSQVWRAVSLVFTDNYIYWGTDGFIKKNNCGIVRMKRSEKALEILSLIDSTVFYSVKFKNNILFGKSGEFSEHLSIIFYDLSRSIVGKMMVLTKQKKRPHGIIRIGISTDKVILSPINTKEFGAISTLICSIKE